MKPRLLLASDNAGKLKEFKSLIGAEFDLVTPGDPALTRFGALDVEENGQTYYENALKKAMGYARTFQLPVLSDDSGLEVDALGGGPGVFSARYGGAEISWPERWACLHRDLKDTPIEKWTARFRCVLCYCDGRSVPQFFQAFAEGRVTPEPHGGKGFGYDPIFFSLDLGRTFAEATDEEKSLTSHRALAARSFLEWWKNRAK